MARAAVAVQRMHRGANARRELHQRRLASAQRYAESKYAAPAAGASVFDNLTQRLSITISNLIGQTESGDGDEHSPERTAAAGGGQIAGIEERVQDVPGAAPRAVARLQAPEDELGC